MSRPTKQQILFRRRLVACAAFIILVALIALICNLVSCGSDNSESEPTQKGGLSFQNMKIELAVGEKYMLIPKFASGANSETELTYTSSDTNILTVDKVGSITAVSEGTANVTAANADKSMQCIVSVSITKSAQTAAQQGSETTAAIDETTTASAETTSAETTMEKPSADAVTAIELSTYSVKINVGEKKMPLVTMKPDSAPDKGEIWSSSNKGIATVDQHGNIKGVKAGSCTVTVKSSASPSVSADVSVTVTELSTSNGVTYINGVLVVNKSYSLPSTYNPGGLTDETSAAFKKMQTAAIEDGITLWIQSGFRSYALQKSIYNNNVSKYGKEKTDTFSARPGNSEHQSGLAFDINVINDTFAGTPEAKWVAENCHKYGFIVRYPEGMSDVTGYKYEPWHLRYLGVETATAVHDSGQCLEQYLGIDSVYKD